MKRMIAGVLPLIGSVAMADERPNIILLFTDQHRFDYIGAVNPNVITPALDELVSSGYMFENGYSSTPSSTPARAALLTGMSPWHHGLLGYSARIKESYKYEMPRMLSQAGYHTVAVGKMHWTPQRNMYGLNELYVDESGRVESEGFESDYRAWFRNVAPHLNPDSLGIGWNDHGAGVYPLADTLHPTYWTAKKSIEVIDAHDKSKPLFLKVSFARPHSPYDPPKRFYEMYEDKEMDAPWIGRWSDPFSKYKHSKDAAFGDYGVGYALNSRKYYAASVTFIDEQIGRVIEKLKEEGLYENSIIIFASDHGDMLGDHYHWRKTYPYEGSTHVPFIVKMPDGVKTKSKRGETMSGVVEIRDILPTFLDAARVEVPKDMDGRSIMEYIIKGEKAEWRDYIDLEHTACYRAKSSWVALTDGKMKYVWNYAEGNEELFDILKDKSEIENLVEDLKYDSQLKLWRERMVKHLSERGETFVKNGKLQVRADLLKSPYFNIESAQ